MGILADYVGNWDAAWGTDVIPGYNDFPKGLLCERAGKGQTGALLYFPGVQPIKALDELLALSGELNGDHTVFHNDIVTNEKLCYFPEEGIFQSFRAFKGMVMIAVLTGTAMILLVVLGMYAGEFKKSSVSAGRRQSDRRESLWAAMPAHPADGNSIGVAAGAVVCLVLW